MYKIQFFETDSSRGKICGRHAYVQRRGSDGLWGRASLELTKNLDLNECGDEKDVPSPVVKAKNKVIESIIEADLETQCKYNG